MGRQLLQSVTGAQGFNGPDFVPIAADPALGGLWLLIGVVCSVLTLGQSGRAWRAGLCF